MTFHFSSSSASNDSLDSRCECSVFECPIFYPYNLDSRPFDRFKSQLWFQLKIILGKLFLLQLVNQLICPDCNGCGNFGLKENNGNLSKGFMKHIIFACSNCEFQIACKTVPETFNSKMLVASEMGPVSVRFILFYGNSIFRMNNLHFRVIFYEDFIVNWASMKSSWMDQHTGMA